MFFAAQVGDLCAGGRSSRERYTEIFAAQFANLLRVELPITKNTQKIFQKFSFKCSGSQSWQLARDLFQSRKSRILHKMGQFLNFFSFPSNISDYSSLSLPEHSQTHRITLKQTFILNHFILKSSRKRYGFFSFSLHISCFELCFLGFVIRY